MPTPQLLTFALRLADAARQAVPPFVGGVVAVENKFGGASFDPVTESDRAAERAMRALIESTYPDHGIAGEEYGEKLGAGQFVWSLDPIDGTRSYTCGLPTWTTLIGLLQDGKALLGVIDTPRLDERYIGHADASWCETANGTTKLRCSNCANLDEARLSTTDPFLFRASDAERFAELQKNARITRYGLDAYAYARLAAGTIDLVVECGLKPHDYQALIPVVRGAGGHFGDWNGGDDFAGGNVIAASTPQLYEAAVQIMGRRSDAAEEPR